MGEKIEFTKAMKGKRRVDMENLIRDLRSKDTSIENMDEFASAVLDDFNDRDYPTNIVSLAQKYGFLVKEFDFEEDHIHGMIAISNSLKDKFGNDKLICIDANDNIADKRFTIAHELGHYFLDCPLEKGAEYFEAYSKVSSPEIREQRANRFAASILMPAEIFKMIFRERIKCSPMHEVVEELANRFSVPMISVRKRINELKL